MESVCVRPMTRRHLWRDTHLRLYSLPYLILQIEVSGQYNSFDCGVSIRWNVSHIHKDESIQIGGKFFFVRSRTKR